MRPAALTSASMRPKRARQSPTSRAGASGSARSAGHEAGGRAGSREGGRRGLAARGVAAGQEQAGGAAGGEGLGDGRGRRPASRRSRARPCPRPEPPRRLPGAVFPFRQHGTRLTGGQPGRALPSRCVLGHGSAAVSTWSAAKGGCDGPCNRRRAGGRPAADGDGRRRAQRLHRRGPSLRHAARRPDRAGRRGAVGRPGERRRLGRRHRHRAGARLCRLARDGARRGGAAGRDRGGGRS